MARRPVFLPDDAVLFRAVEVDFVWHAGMSLSQQQKCIQALHDAAGAMGVHRVLEISTRSAVNLGRELSAFNLRVRLSTGESVPVECAYQASKVFSQGGPFHDLLRARPHEARGDERLRASGELVAFEFEGTRWPLSPVSAFYISLYVRALHENAVGARQLLNYQAFSDIAFNPQKSLSTQASGAAAYVALTRTGKMLSVLEDARNLVTLLSCCAQTVEQRSLFNP